MYTVVVISRWQAGKDSTYQNVNYHVKLTTDDLNFAIEEANGYNDRYQDLIGGQGFEVVIRVNKVGAKYLKSSAR